MQKRMQAVVLFIEPQEVKSMTPLKAGNLFMNRLAIDENESNEILKFFEFENLSERINMYIVSVCGRPRVWMWIHYPIEHLNHLYHHLQHHLHPTTKNVAISYNEHYFIEYKNKRLHCTINISGIMPFEVTEGLEFLFVR